MTFAFSILTSRVGAHVPSIIELRYSENLQVSIAMFK